MASGQKQTNLLGDNALIWNLNVLGHDFLDFDLDNLVTVLNLGLDLRRRLDHLHRLLDGLHHHGLYGLYGLDMLDGVMLDGLVNHLMVHGLRHNRLRHNLVAVPDALRRSVNGRHHRREGLPKYKRDPNRKHL
jgi:hypothetical protein